MVSSRKPTVGVIDSGIGTWSSVVNVFEYIGVEVAPVSNPKKLNSFSHVVLPGVGNFSKAANILSQSGWSQAIEAFVKRGDLLLGICLGMQLLGKSSEEGDAKGLGLLDFTSVALSRLGPKRVPNIGWATLNHGENHPLMSGIGLDSKFYFSHGYAVNENAFCSIAQTVHNETFSSVVAEGQIFGVQFHPEKSHSQGRKLLSNFAGL